MIYYRKNLNKLVYEDINDEYGYGKYEDFEVVIRKIDGYINVTKLCKDGNKSYNNWKKSNHAQISIQSVQTYHNIPEERILELVNGGSNYKISGTYAHPALVPHIASWVSVDFFNMVSDVVNNHIVNKYEEELKEKEYQLRSLERMPDPEGELLIIFYTDEKEEKPYRFARIQRRSLPTLTKNLIIQYPKLREVVGLEINQIQWRVGMFVKEHLLKIWNGLEIILDWWE